MATVTTRYIDYSSVGGDGTTKGLTGSTAAFKTITEWESSRQRDLTASDEIENPVLCSNGGGNPPTKGKTVITGWTTDATRYIDGTCEFAHGGAWNSSIGRIEFDTTDGNYLDIQENFVRLTGWQIKTIANTTSNMIVYGIGVTGTFDVRISKCIIAATGKTCDSGIITTGSSSGTLYIYNCILYDIDYASGGHRAAIKANDGNSLKFEVFNNTIHNCYRGIHTVTTVPAHEVKNNLIASCTVATVGLTGSATVDYNSTDLASLGYTAQAGDRVSQTFTFNNEAGDDFHITTSDTGAGGYGVTDPGSGLFSDDIDGTARSAPWDIGATVAVAGAASTVPPLFMHYAFSRR